MQRVSELVNELLEITRLAIEQSNDRDDENKRKRSLLRSALGFAGDVAITSPVLTGVGTWMVARSLRNSYLKRKGLTKPLPLKNAVSRRKK